MWQPFVLAYNENAGLNLMHLCVCVRSFVCPALSLSLPNNFDWTLPTSVTLPTVEKWREALLYTWRFRSFAPYAHVV